MITDEDIKREFLAAGFTIKPGCDDLRPYVYEAARRVIALAEAEPTAERDALHVAVCQAVALLNRSPGTASCPEGREAHAILRQSLVAHADAYMDQPVTEAEREAVARKHRKGDKP